MNIQSGLNILQLVCVFWFCCNHIDALFCMALGIPIGLLIVDGNTTRRTVYTFSILIPLLDYIRFKLVNHWYILTIEGICQTVYLFHIFDFTWLKIEP